LDPFECQTPDRIRQEAALLEISDSDASSDAISSSTDADEQWDQLQDAWHGFLMSDDEDDADDVEADDAQVPNQLRPYDDRQDRSDTNDNDEHHHKFIPKLLGHGNLTFLSARPHIYKGFSERASYQKFKTMLGAQVCRALTTQSNQHGCVFGRGSKTRSGACITAHAYDSQFASR
jgi:hypothetical protein